MPVVLIDDEDVRLVANTSPDLGVGKATMIYDDPISRENPEGVAVIREILRDMGDGMIRADVEFQNEPGETYSRLIFTRKWAEVTA